MSTVDFFRASFRALHDQLDKGIGDLDEAQLHYRPEGKGNHIAFTVWHYARTEDNVIQGRMLGKPSTWVDQGFDKKLGLDATAQGTRMSAEDAGRIRIASIPDLLAYQKQVWEATDAYLSTIDDSKLTELLTLGQMGETPVSRLIGNILLTHGFSHLGEVQYIRGLLGR